MLLLIPLPFLRADQNDHLAIFADPATIWGNGIERLIEEAYRACFRMRIIDGRIMNIRIPFGENHERDFLLDTGWSIVGGGKGTPGILWPVIEEILDSDDFARYTATLSDGREQVIIFDISHQSWHSSRDLHDIARMKAGSYGGLPHRPHVFSSGRGINEADVYNYLYSIGHVGMDCSGFVWYVLSYVAQHQSAIDLNRVIGRTLRIPANADTSRFIGTSFFNSTSSHIIRVPDRISSLRPADIILFRGPNGNMAHAAIIQSIDMNRGIIRYLQSTDEAPQHERGVHESFIHFDPAQPDVSLGSSDLHWTQQRQAPFPGEQPSPFSDDGRRYRAFPEHGGGRVVRLRQIR